MRINSRARSVAKQAANVNEIVLLARILVKLCDTCSDITHVCEIDRVSRLINQAR
jgi:hypothetical protein